MRVTIYGLGTVGGALYRHLKARGHDIVRIDPGLGIHDIATHKPDCVFLCVPVPTKHFKTDLSIIDGILEEYQHSDIPIFLRSTVLPGTADRLTSAYNVTVISCPEFLTERKADRDTASLPIIYGKQGHKIMESLFPEHTRIPMLNTEAEMAKYAHNCFGAVKVTYFNAIAEHCKRLGLSYDRVLTGTLASGHINRQHTQVPGPDGQFGYGGKCFPKDMQAFSGFFKSDIFGKMLLDIECMNRFYRGYKDNGKRPQGEIQELTEERVYGAPV